jgi:hypothetical protein
MAYKQGTTEKAPGTLKIFSVVSVFSFLLSVDDIITKF